MECRVDIALPPYDMLLPPHFGSIHGVAPLRKPKTVFVAFHCRQLFNVCRPMHNDDAQTLFHTKSLRAAQSCHTEMPAPPYLDSSWCELTFIYGKYGLYFVRK